MAPIDVTISPNVEGSGGDIEELIVEGQKTEVIPIITSSARKYSRKE